jgi:hypothetical protein
MNTLTAQTFHVVLLGPALPVVAAVDSAAAIPTPATAKAASATAAPWLDRKGSVFDAPSEFVVPWIALPAMVTRGGAVVAKTNSYLGSVIAVQTILVATHRFGASTGAGRIMHHL